MIFQTDDLSDLPDAMGEYKDKAVGFDPEVWPTIPGNIALTDGEGSYILLDYESPGVYYAHNFYRKRGRQAIDLAKEALRYAFDNYPIELSKGLTPVTNLGARYVARQAGFKSHGIIQSAVGPLEVFILTRNEYESL